MFATIGHTFELMKMSWGVLMKDRELIFFPILAGVSLLVLIGAFLAVASTTGTIDRLDALAGETSEEEVQAVDAILGLAFVFLSSAIVIFFNAALVAAALERLRGGRPQHRLGHPRRARTPAADSRVGTDLRGRLAPAARAPRARRHRRADRCRAWRRRVGPRDVLRDPGARLRGRRPDRRDQALLGAAAADLGPSAHLELRVRPDHQSSRC